MPRPCLPAQASRGGRRAEFAPPAQRRLLLALAALLAHAAPLADGAAPPASPQQNGALVPDSLKALEEAAAAQPEAAAVAAAGRLMRSAAGDAHTAADSGTAQPAGEADQARQKPTMPPSSQADTRTRGAGSAPPVGWLEIASTGVAHMFSSVGMMVAGAADAAVSTSAARGTAPPAQAAAVGPAGGAAAIEVPLVSVPVKATPPSGPPAPAPVLVGTGAAVLPVQATAAPQAPAQASPAQPAKTVAPAAPPGPSQPAPAQPAPGDRQAMGDNESLLVALSLLVSVLALLIAAMALAFSTWAHWGPALVFEEHGNMGSRHIPGAPRSRRTSALYASMTALKLRGTAGGHWTEDQSPSVGPPSSETDALRHAMAGSGEESHGSAGTAHFASKQRPGHLPG